MARQALQAGGSGSVMGVTSTGAFLRVHNRIVFLTTLPYLSPHNLQIAPSDGLLKKLAPGDAFQVSGDQINFPAIRVSLDTSQSVTWTPEPPVACRTPMPQQLEVTGRLLKQIHAAEGDKGFLFVSQPQQPVMDSIQVKINAACQQVLHAFRSQDLVGIQAASETLLGAGGGLTPSGDDFLTGFFLYHIRVCHSLEISPEFSLLALDEVIRRAREKTTTISVNRLQAARNGWAEDIFLKLLDHLFDPNLQPLPENLVQILFNFGHSSGIDTLVGIHFGISSLIKK